MANNGTKKINSPNTNYFYVGFDIISRDSVDMHIEMENPDTGVKATSSEMLDVYASSILSNDNFFNFLREVTMRALVIKTKKDLDSIINTIKQTENQAKNN